MGNLELIETHSHCFKRQNCLPPLCGGVERDIMEEGRGREIQLQQYGIINRSERHRKAMFIFKMNKGSGTGLVGPKTLFLIIF